jgi:predicted patatin/cPLA2 family phospholipase
MDQIGLVLEGGGMRGVYTGGVLDYFMEKELYFPYVIGVSAGACNGSSYISRQPGRNKRVTIDYIRDPRYLSYRNLFKEKSLFGMGFLFDALPYRLEPFDFDTFYRSEQQFVIVTTDCVTGRPVYFNKDDGHDVLKVLQASSSLPFIAQPVKIDGLTLMDGGIADPVPIRKAQQDGNRKNVVVLTRNRAYKKKPFKFKRLAKKVYPQYEGLVEALISRYKVYNDTMQYIEQLERGGEVFAIRPSQPLKVSRLEKNRKALLALYEQGYHDAKQLYERLLKFLATGEQK